MMARLLAVLLVGMMACVSQSALAQDKAPAKKEAVKTEAKPSAGKDDEKKADKQGETSKPVKKKRIGGCG